MNSSSLLLASTEVDAFCQRQGWAYCFLGGLAVLRWGEPRLTRDADLCLFVGWGQEQAFSQVLLEHYAPRQTEAERIASELRVLLLQHPNGTPLDIIYAALPFEERCIQRSSHYAISKDLGYRTCSAEDLIVHKVFAGRPRDWSDVASVVARQGERLDFGLIERELLPLLDILGEPERLERLYELRSS